MNTKNLALATTILLTSCQSYYKGKILSVDSFNLRVRTEVTSKHIVTAVIDVEQLDTIIKQGAIIYIDKKTLKVIK